LKRAEPKAPSCPECGKPVVHGGNSRGVPRYICRTKGKLCWHGTRPINEAAAATAGIDRGASKARHRKIKSARGVQRYVITSAQNATPVNRPFFASLRVYCKANNAQLIVIPYRYKNPTSMWTQEAKEDDWWADEVLPYIMAERTPLGPHVEILGDIMTQPTASSPLQGFEALEGAKTTIIGHPKLELKTVPTPQSKLPKILTTTGACTVKNYIPAKAGKKAEFHHTFGACVLELDGDEFHIRQLNALKNGSFMDLDTNYTPAGKSKVARAAALVLGDLHAEFVDPDVVKGTFGKGGIIDTLNPESVVFHDLWDGYARNHHHRHDPIIGYVKHHAGVGNVEKSLDETFAFVDKHSRPGTKNIFVPSNHHDVLSRWIKESDPRLDPENCVFWARTFTAMCEGSSMGEAGARMIDPFAYWGMAKLKSRKQAVFLKRDESMLIKGIEVGYHGDRGPNGARGSRKSFSHIGVKTVVGHSHSPGITGGTYQTGTSSYLALEYNSGPSGWLHTHVVIYANGKRSLISIINGKWRA